MVHGVYIIENLLKTMRFILATDTRPTVLRLSIFGRYYKSIVPLLNTRWLHKRERHLAASIRTTTSLLYVRVLRLSRGLSRAGVRLAASTRPTTLPRVHSRADLLILRGGGGYGQEFFKGGGGRVLERQVRGNSPTDKETKGGGGSFM